MAKDRLLVVCPVFNEEGRIGPLLEQLKPVLRETDELLIVNDGSTDNTLQEIKSFNVDVISHPKNFGKGKAIQTGCKYFLKTDFSHLIFIDGDGQHNPDNIHDFMEMFEFNSKIDLIIANRFATSTWQKNMPFSRKLTNLLSRLGLWILYNGLIIPDPQNGYRGYTRKVISEINFSAYRYEAEMEILIEAYVKGFTCGFLPIESIYNSETHHSKFSKIFDTWKIPIVMVKGFFKNKPWLLR